MKYRCLKCHHERKEKEGDCPLCEWGSFRCIGTKKAKYQCIKCNYSWESLPETYSCPSCKNYYVKWTNYIENWNE